MRKGAAIALATLASTVSIAQGVNWQIWTTKGEENVTLEQLANPRTPDLEGQLKNFNFNADVLDNFGARVAGYLTPKSSGEYTFYIASDDQSRLLISSDEKRDNQRLIAQVDKATSPKEFDKTPQQKSKKIKLEAGKKYYIEAVMVELGGPDHLSVAWEGPDFSRTIIDGKYLSPINKVKNKTGFPTKKSPVNLGDFANLISLAVETKDVEAAAPLTVKANPVAKDFPGEVGTDASRLKQVKVDINASYEGNDPRFCYAGARDWVMRSTGLYAPAGEVVTVKLPQPLIDAGFKVQIGCHTDTLWHLKKVVRAPDLCNEQTVKSTATEIASQFGGLIYIIVPENSKKGVITAEISGAVKAPYFELGKTTDKEWNENIRNLQAPMAELASNRVIFSVPSNYIRNLENPTELLTFWNSVLDADADLSGRPRTRVRPERIVFDRQISAGWMHSGYPIMAPLASAAKLVSAERMKKEGDWGMYHELGHNHQCLDWVLDGETEVSVNIFSVYTYQKINGRDSSNTHGAISPKNRQRSIDNFLKDGKKGPFTALLTYMMLQEKFGWDLFKRVYLEYNYIPAKDLPKTNQEKTDRVIETFSRQSGYNLVPFFKHWNYKISPEVVENCSQYKEWKDNPMLKYITR